MLLMFPSFMAPFVILHLSPPLPPDVEQCLNCDSVLSSLEAEQKETARLQKENKALVNGIFQLQAEVILLFFLVLHSFLSLSLFCFSTPPSSSYSSSSVGF